MTSANVCSGALLASQRDVELLLHVGRGQRRLQRFADLLHDLLRRSLWHHDTEPRRRHTYF
jgi:hypothetical protein